MTNKNETQKEDMYVSKEYKADVACKYFPGICESHAMHKLREYIESNHPELFQMIYGIDSPYFISRCYFSAPQIKLIDKCIKEEKLRYRRNKINAAGNYNIQKISLAKMLFPNVFPEVAMNRMMLMLERNYHALDDVFKNKTALESKMISLSNAYKICYLFDNQKVMDWLLDIANSVSKSEAGETEDLDADACRKSEIYRLYTGIKCWKRAKYTFNTMLRSIPNAYDAVYNNDLSRYKHCFTKGQMREIEKYLGPK